MSRQICHTNITDDEMQYPKVVPRDAVVAEILKSAKGRINRHRL